MPACSCGHDPMCINIFSGSVKVPSGFGPWWAMDPHDAVVYASVQDMSMVHRQRMNDERDQIDESCRLVQSGSTLDANVGGTEVGW
jgi:hypothetical protein